MAPTYAENTMLRDQIGRQEWIASRCSHWPVPYQALMPVTCNAVQLWAAERKIRLMMVADAFQVIESLVALPDGNQNRGLCCIDWDGMPTNDRDELEPHPLKEPERDAAGAAARAAIAERIIRQVAAAQIELVRAIGRCASETEICELRKKLREVHLTYSRVLQITEQETVECGLSVDSEWIDPLTRL